MIEVIERAKCTGCGACYTACAHQAITMQFDEEGFEYPVINKDICVDCRLCRSVCPVLQYDKRQQLREDNNDAQKGFAARNTNLTQRLISSSGSIFPPIAEWILENGGLVVGVAYDEVFNAKHVIINSFEGIKSIQGSKYLQCKADNTTFKLIKNELETGKLVLYSGMACQVEGLKSYLRKEYENLYTIDLICMGIPSSVVWQRYLSTFFKGERIEYVNFKEKSIGWNSFCFYLKSDKKEFKERGMGNLYLQSMFRSWNMRPSCFHCPFKKEKRLSDFTLADCWGANKLVPEINDNKGLSSVIVHSKKGLFLWKKLKDRIESIEITIKDITEGNSNLNENKPQLGGRELFYKMLNDNPRKAFEKLCAVKQPSILSRIKCKMLSILRKIIGR